MKTTKVLKSTSVEGQLGRKLEDLVRRIPNVEPQGLQSVAPIFGHQQPDFLLPIKLGRKKVTIVLEAKSLGQPQPIRAALLQVQQFLRQAASKQVYGVVGAPFISEDSAKLCEEAGVGYIDLAGNSRLAFDSVYIETRSSENPFREKRESRSLFAPKATRVLRFLLTGPLRPWRVTELASSTEVSFGWVSAVRQQLLAREWAIEEPSGLRITKPGAILDSWAKADDWQKRTSVHEYSSLTFSDPLEFANKLQNLIPEAEFLFTGGIAAWLRHPYSTPPIVTAYVKHFPADSIIETRLLARRVSTGGRLYLVVPKDLGVFQIPQHVRDLKLASDVQIYLDLLHAGNRADEQAAELRKWPDFAGGWG